MSEESRLFRSAYHLWEAKYPHGGLRFVLFAALGIALSLVPFGFGIAVIMGIEIAIAGGTSSRADGVGFCVVSLVALSALLSSIKSYADKHEATHDGIQR